MPFSVALELVTFVAPSLVTGVVGVVKLTTGPYCVSELLELVNTVR